MGALVEYLVSYQEWGHFLLRAVVAVIFLAHGYPKIKNLRQTAENFGMMGFRPGVLWGTAVAALEVVGGAALLLGFWTELFAVLFAGEMIVAAFWKICRGQGLVNGYELDLLLIVASLVVATSGAGVLSLDGYLAGISGF